MRRGTELRVRDVLTGTILQHQRAVTTPCTSLTPAAATGRQTDRQTDAVERIALMGRLAVCLSVCATCSSVRRLYHKETGRLITAAAFDAQRTCNFTRWSLHIHYAWTILEMGLTLISPTPQIITLCHTGLTYYF